METTDKIRKQVELFRTYLTAKHYSKRTIEQYCSILKMFLSDFKEYPRDINSNQITVWIASKGNASTMGSYRGALLNYYTHVVGQPNKFKRIPYPKKENRLPKILSQEVILERINSIRNFKHRMIVSVLYGSGVRLSELLELAVVLNTLVRNPLKQPFLFSILAKWKHGQILQVIADCIRLARMGELGELWGLNSPRIRIAC